MQEVALGREFPHKVIPLIKEAKKSIEIIAYDWRWYPDQSGSINTKFNQAIIGASRAGVKVRALLNSEIIVHTLKSMNINARRIPSGKKLHTKLMIIDDEISIMGSHNYTTSAFMINFEASLITHDSKIALELKNYFENLFIM